MNKQIEGFLNKLLERARSSRVWTVASGNVVGITLIEDGWPRAGAIIAVNGLYILSETVIKLWGNMESAP